MPRSPIRIQKTQCSYCTNTQRNPETHQHDLCPGAIRIPDTERVIVCSCCAPKTGVCTTCGNRTKNEVDLITWYCLDRYACAARVQARMLANPLHKMIQDARLDAASNRRRKRLDTIRIRSGIDPSDPNEADSFENHRPVRMSRPKTGECLCCGDTTKGGRFLPGHDAKLVSRLIAELDAGNRAVWEQVMRLGWSGKPAFRKRAPKEQASA